MSEKMFWIELATSGELWVAPEIADLVAGLIPGYLDIGPDWREPSRRAYAVAVMTVVQQELFAAALACGAVDLATIPDGAVDRMLGYGDPDDLTPWEFEVPLIVLGGSDDWRPPLGNVVVVDARRDGSLLLSLAAIGELKSLDLLSGPALLLHPLGL